MAELVIPAGFTVAWVVLNLVGWYGGWRKGLELIHQDIRASKTVRRDIEAHLEILESHKKKVEEWRKLWWISDGEFQAPEPQAPESRTQDKKGKRKKGKGKGLPTCVPKLTGPPDEFFQQLWGSEHFTKIQRSLEDITKLFEEKELHLSPYMRLSEGEKIEISALRDKYLSSVGKKLLKGRYIFWDKAAFSTDGSIEEFSRLLLRIQDEAETGWQKQKKTIIHNFEPSEFEVGRLNKLQPYHVLMAYCLAKIGGDTGGQDDAEKLRSFSQQVRRDFVIVVDADIFKLAALAFEGKDVHTAADYIDGSGRTRWKVDLLLREADKPMKEFVRVKFERSAENVILDRMSDAFDKLLSAQQDKVYFSSEGDVPLKFGLTRVRDAGSYPRIQSTIQEDFAKTLKNTPLTESELDNLDRNTTPAHLYSEISTYRAAFELAQATLLFLGTSWFGDLCRCAFWTCKGEGRVRYRFGLAMTSDAHNSRPWRSTDGQGNVAHIEEALDCKRSWCSTNYSWDDMNRGPRRLGLLLIELALGTIVMPSLRSDCTNSAPGAYKVENISVLVKVQNKPHEYEWKEFTRERVLSLANQRSFHNKDDFKHAVDYCLTERFPQSPNDMDREFHLKKFYFRVVKPFRDMYAWKSNGGEEPEYYLK